MTMANGKVTRGDIAADLKPSLQAAKQKSSGGGGGFGGTGNVGMLGVARVITINYEEYTATLRVVLGEDQEFQRVPIAMTFPGAGRRHFFGAMPEEGDYCVIGHISQETDGRTATPVILAWVLPGTWMGHDWMMSQPFAPDEFSMDPKDTFFVAGAFQRSRHKLRHMEPGHVVCSSSQGSDLVLTEEVQLANRRGNEIILRDPDQAIVMRAQQQFTALAGTRTYSGMVQRDATFLPSQMFSDGILWDGPRQINIDENRPWTDEELRDFGSGSLSPGDLTPNTVFERREDDGLLGDRQSGVFFEKNVDPFSFLRRGGFITSSGRSVDGREENDAVYGGKSFYRVSSLQANDGRPVNAVIGNSLEESAYTEHRIEVTHTSNGRLPVTEQTDGFDAERLPRTSIEADGDLLRSSSSPFIEQVLGTVVGNDPYTRRGRALYGLPLKPVIFDGIKGAGPTLEAATNAELGEQAAIMTRLFPPVQSDLFATPSFYGLRKDGRFYASIGGPQNVDYSAEVALLSGLRLNCNGKLRLEFQGLELSSPNGDAKNNLGLDLKSDHGAVRVYGGGNTTAGELGARTAPNEVTESFEDLPSLCLEGAKNVLVKGARKISQVTAELDSRADRIRAAAMTEYAIRAGERLSTSSKTLDQIVNGKATYNFHGPKDNLPSNGAFRSTTISGLGVGVVDEYKLIQGDREETLLQGDHTTTVVVGNLTYEATSGTWKARAGTNELSVDVSSGLSGQISTGNINLDALAGATSISASVSFTAKTQGLATISGSAGVTLGGPGGKVGGIVSASDIDPLTGLPLATFGMGSSGHTLGPPV